jgi:hypothetical protein
MNYIKLIAAIAVLSYHIAASQPFPLESVVYIKPGDRIIEATSGNSSISFSAIGKALGHPVTIIMPTG